MDQKLFIYLATTFVASLVYPKRTRTNKRNMASVQLFNHIPKKKIIFLRLSSSLKKVYASHQSTIYTANRRLMMMTTHTILLHFALFPFSVVLLKKARSYYIFALFPFLIVLLKKAIQLESTCLLI